MFLVLTRPQKTADGSTMETQVGPLYTQTQRTSWCPASSVLPCPSRGVSTQSRSQVADPVLPTTCGRTPTPYPQTLCTTTPTSTPLLTNTTWVPRLGRRRTLYPASEDTHTTTTWTPPRLTCTQRPAAPLTTTTGPDNNHFPLRVNGLQRYGNHNKNRDDVLITWLKLLPAGWILLYLFKENASLH